MWTVVVTFELEDKCDYARAWEALAPLDLRRELSGVRLPSCTGAAQMPASMTAEELQHMVREQLEARGLRARAVLIVMGGIPSAWAVE